MLTVIGATVLPYCSFAGELDILVQKLIEKNILSPLEGQIILDETRADVAKQNAQGTNDAIPTWIQNTKLKGDVRLRYQYERREKDLEGALKQYDFRMYVDQVFEVVDQANEEIDRKAPFKLVKEDKAAAERVLSQVCDQIRFIGRALEPILPQTSQEILRRYGTIVETGEALFPRRDERNIP